MEIQTVFNEARDINVYNEGVKTTYSLGDENYKNILDCWNKTIEDSHQMPALGVSINSYTVEEMKHGLWVEFCFERQIQRSELPFEKLLVNVNKGFYGFNVVRYTAQRGYDGRCFYLDLNGKTMDDFYAFLSDLG
ncbi:MAG: hypothetical protein K2L42_05180 [Clostridia bacterium]|nr:hypothetical protein [Clostridia bacterium]